MVLVRGDELTRLKGPEDDVLLYMLIPVTKELDEAETVTFTCSEEGDTEEDTGL